MTERKKPSDVDRDLSLVHAANQGRLEDLDGRLQKAKQDTELVIAEVEAALGGAQRGSSLACAVSLPQKTLGTPSALTWSELVEQSREYLELRGERAPTGTYDLLSADDNARITAELNRPMYARVPWDRWDFVIAAGAGLVGGLLDVLVGTPGHFLQGAMTDKGHWLGQWMESIHERAPGGAPIDFQGKGPGYSFGGPFHRGRTIGHDLLRPIEGIRQFHDGAFRGFYYRDGVRHTVEKIVNQNGVPYETLSWGGAAIAWLVHLFCDYFSSLSLPIPGTSWLFDTPDHDVRVFVQQDLYQQGINARHLTLQLLPPLAVEIVVRSAMFIRYRGAERDEGYQQKQAEMLAMAHGVSLAWNLGKIVVMQNPLLLNVPQLLATMRVLFRVLVMEHLRTSDLSKALRNARSFHERQQQIDGGVRRLRSPLVLS